MLVGVQARQSENMQTTTGRTTHFGDFGPFQSKSTNDDGPAVGQSFANGSRTWGPSIWGNNTIGSGFGPAARDSNRGRADNATYVPNADVEAKKGSASLVASSESDSWGRRRSVWGAADAAAGAKTPLTMPRSSGVSPSRPISNHQPQAQQSYIEPSQPSSSYFPTGRAGSISHTTSSMARPSLDPTSGSFSLGRPQESLSNGFSNLSLGGRFHDAEGQAQRAPEQPVNAWPDSASVHSPSDDRRSIANSDYFVSSSNGPSRSGSLPPSRHGADPPLIPQNFDGFSRFAQMPTPSRTHNSSFSRPNGRAFAERSASIPGDVGLFNRLSLDNDAERPLDPFKQSLGATGGSGYESPSAFDLTGDMGQGLPRSEEPSSLSGRGSFASDSPASGFYADALLQARGLQYNTRLSATPSASSFRHSPYVSHPATPPTFDHLYPSRGEQQSRSLGQSAINPQALHDELQQIDRVKDFHFAQEHQRMLATNYPHMVAAAAAAGQHRGPYNHFYNPATIMNMNPMHPGLSMQGLAGPFAPYGDVPSAPREQLPSDIRSKLLDEFKANNKTNKKYELKDIYDHIAEFSGDQHGSRFIQSKLETANSEEKERVFREIYPESLQLMQDVFGNYVIQKFFEHGDQSQKKALANKMKGNMLQLSLQMYGCRVVQKALEHILSDQQASLVKELENHVIRCVKDQNGNHVIQKAIERVPPEHIQFIFNAFTGQVATLATHAYGCRVIQRMLEHCEPPTRNSILQELHLCGVSLITDSYGNYVTQHIIEHGGAEDRAKVINLIKDQLLSFSKHKFASNVVEKCLVYGTDEQRHQIMMKIAEPNERGESNLLSLIKDGYGNYVIQKLLDTLSFADYTTFVDYLQPEMVKAKRLISGKHVQAVEKKMHRFDRYDNLPENPGHASISTTATGTDRYDSLSDNPGRASISTTATSTDRSAAATPPPLTNDTQSPPSTSVPSTSNSTSGEAEPMALANSKPPVSSLTEGGVSISTT